MLNPETIENTHKNSETQPELEPPANEDFLKLFGKLIMRQDPDGGQPAGLDEEPSSIIMNVEDRGIRHYGVPIAAVESNPENSFLTQTLIIIKDHYVSQSDPSGWFIAQKTENSVWQVLSVVSSRHESTNSGDAICLSVFMNNASNQGPSQLLFTVDERYQLCSDVVKVTNQYYGREVRTENYLPIPHSDL